MWVEIVNGKPGNSFADDAAVITANGTQYPWNFPKSQIPNFVNVAIAALPDPEAFIVTGYTITFANGSATQVLTTQAVPIAQAQATQVAVLRAAAVAAITGGYQSSALGAVHTYPSTPTDQINMLGSVSASLLPGLPASWTTEFWCQDSTGAWAYQPHTAAQIQQAGSDGKAWITTCQTKLATLTNQAMTAGNLAAVRAVTW